MLSLDYFCFNKYIPIIVYNKLINVKKSLSQTEIESNQGGFHWVRG